MYISFHAALLFLLIHMISVSLDLVFNVVTMDTVISAEVARLLYAYQLPLLPVS